jgi:hypothetical protein
MKHVHCALLAAVCIGPWIAGGCWLQSKPPTDMRPEMVAVQEPTAAPNGNGPALRPVTFTGPPPEEIGLVEGLVAARNAYKAALQALDRHYLAVAEGTKRQWVHNELTDFARSRKYRYLAEAEIAGPNLRAAEAVPAADALYKDAMHYKDAFAILDIGKEQKLRIALDKLNRILREHPTSDKIDDAAFHAAEIYRGRHFKDYWRALLYYQRAFQWDPKTPWPARLRAAQVLDRELLDRRAALKLYHEAARLERDERHRREASSRIVDITRRLDSR